MQGVVVVRAIRVKRVEEQRIPLPRLDLEPHAAALVAEPCTRHTTLGRIGSHSGCGGISDLASPSWLPRPCHPAGIWSPRRPPHPIDTGASSQAAGRPAEGRRLCAHEIQPWRSCPWVRPANPPTIHCTPMKRPSSNARGQVSRYRTPHLGPIVRLLEDIKVRVVVLAVLVPQEVEGLPMGHRDHRHLTEAEEDQAGGSSPFCASVGLAQGRKRERARPEGRGQGQGRGRPAGPSTSAPTSEILSSILARMPSGSCRRDRNVP